MHRLAQHTGLVDAIDRHVEVLKVHLASIESVPHLFRVTASRLRAWSCSQRRFARMSRCRAHSGCAASHCRSLRATMPRSFEPHVANQLVSGFHSATAPREAATAEFVIAHALPAATAGRRRTSAIRVPSGDQTGKSPPKITGIAFSPSAGKRQISGLPASGRRRLKAMRSPMAASVPLRCAGVRFVRDMGGLPMKKAGGRVRECRRLVGRFDGSLVVYVRTRGSVRVCGRRSAVGHGIQHVHRAERPHTTPTTRPYLPSIEP